MQTVELRLKRMRRQPKKERPRKKRKRQLNSKKSEEMIINLPF